MPGEQSRVGWANTALFSEIVEKFGWIQRGPIDENIPCDKCGKYKNGNWKSHGVDALFTIKCPYSNRNRAIIVDGKRYEMNSVGGPTKLEGWLKDTIKTTQHARESKELLKNERNMPDNTLFDTAMVVWDCHLGWDNEKAKEWIKNVNIKSYPTPPVIGFITTKDYLNRLQTIEQYKKTVSDLQFLYIIKSVTKWSDVMAPEILHSSIIAVRFKNHGNKGWNYGAFYFDESIPANISFLAHYLSHSGLLTHDSLSVFIPCQNNEVEIFQTHLSSSFKDNKGFGEQTELICKRIPLSTFAS